MKLFYPGHRSTIISSLISITFGVVLFTFGMMWSRALPSHATDSFMYLWQADLFVKTPVLEWDVLIAGFSKSFYSLVIALFGLFNFNLEVVGVFVSLIAGTISVFFTGMVAFRLFDSSEMIILPNEVMIPLISCSILTLNPIFIDYSGRILSESTFTALSIIGTSLTIHFLHTSRFKVMIAASVVLGFSALTREIGSSYVILLAIIPFICKLPLKKKIFTSILGVAIFTVVNLPVLCSGVQSSLGQFNLIRHQETSNFMSQEDAAYSLNDSATGFKIDEASQTSLIQFVKRNFIAMIFRVKDNVKSLIIILWNFSWGVSILSVIGALFWLTSIKYYPSRVIVYIFTVILLLVYLPFHLEFRYLVPILPFLSIFATAAITRLVYYASLFRIRQIYMMGFLCVILGVSYYHTYIAQVRPELLPANNLIEEQELGNWLKTKIIPGSTIMARKPDIAYYASANFISLPFAEWSQIYQYACGRGVDILVLSKRFMMLRPQLLYLYDTTLKHDGLQLLAEYEASNKVHLIVYKILCSRENRSTQSLYSPNQFWRFGH